MSERRGDRVKERFADLAALTRGAAVVTLGMGTASAVAAGCTKNEASSQPAVAAASSAEADTADASTDAGARARRRFPIPNALHPGWRFGDAGSSGSGPDGSSGP